MKSDNIHSYENVPVKLQLHMSNEIGNGNSHTLVCCITRCYKALFNVNMMFRQDSR